MTKSMINHVKKKKKKRNSNYWASDNLGKKNFTSRVIDQIAVRNMTVFFSFDLFELLTLNTPRSSVLFSFHFP